MFAAQNSGLNIEIMHEAAHALVTERVGIRLTVAQQAPPSQSPPMQPKLMPPASVVPPLLLEDDVDPSSVALASSVVAGEPLEDELQPAETATPKMDATKRMLLVCVKNLPPQNS